MRVENGSIFTPPQYGDISQDNHDIDPEGGRRRKKAVYVCGDLPTHVEISGLPGGWVTRKNIQPRKTYGKMYVQTPEFKNRDYTGDPDTNPTVQPMQDEHACDEAGMAHPYDQVQQDHGYKAMEEG